MGGGHDVPGGSGRRLLRRRGDVLERCSQHGRGLEQRHGLVGGRVGGWMGGWVGGWGLCACRVAFAPASLFYWYARRVIADSHRHTCPLLSLHVLDPNTCQPYTFLFNTCTRRDNAFNEASVMMLGMADKLSPAFLANVRTRMDWNLNLWHVSCTAAAACSRLALGRVVGRLMRVRAGVWT